MQLKCPHGHLAVVRNDPDTSGYLAQCDTCGWSAPKLVAREGARFETDKARQDEQFLQPQEEEHGRRQLTAAQPESGRRRGE
jgi:hypothetical protein